MNKLISEFHGRILPEEATMSGYGALIHNYDLQVPLPEKLAAISQQHRRYDTDNWSIYTPRHMPENTLAGHLIFALNYEGVDLTILSALFNKINGKEIENIVQNEPTGSYSRRIWFFHEWLTGIKLNLDDATSGNFVDALNSEQYYTASQEASKRHRVNNNLPGVRDFCPLVRRTEKLENYIKKNLLQLAYQKVEAIHPDILNRAAAFLLLKDSRASFAIEGEYPNQNRAERWGQIIGQAGTNPLSTNELLRLQRIVLANSKYVKFGLRTEGGFIGVHDRSTGSPIPDHISAKYTDLDRLMNGLLSTNQILRQSNVDAVISAAIIAFGFVFIHPFEDSNGRIHRYLLHNSFAEHGFVPKGMVFPVSAVILEHMTEYKKILESYSNPRLEFIEWKATEKGNVEVLNNTIDLYRYFDATKQAEFLYDCVDQTIRKVLPEEIRYLQNYDQLKNEINQRFDMPDYKVSLLISFLEQNKGKFSQRAKTKEFEDINENDLNTLEELYFKFMSHTKNL
jgi:Fic family protein